MTIFAGLDIGGTKVLAAGADASGKIIRRALRTTPVGLDEGLSMLEELLEEVSGGEDIAGIGIAIGGPLDYESGVVSPLHQPEWSEVPLLQIIGERHHCRISIDVDTNVAAIGEYRMTKETAARFLYLTLSTGMGGGFVVDGKIYRGAGGVHPEPGHISISHHLKNPSTIICECGAQDCLEALISGNGIRRIYGKPAEDLAENEWDEVAYNLGQGLRSIASLYAPDIISIGGGISHHRGEKLLAPARAVMERHLRLVKPPIVRVSPLGYDTALLGAVSAAIHGL